MEKHSLSNIKLKELNKLILGNIFNDFTYRTIYSTDASVYKETPLAVVFPLNANDIKQIVIFADKNNIPLIPRAAGTSLAGQVVGNGLVVDVSKYMNRIGELNIKEKWIKVQPGVVLEELNIYLNQFDLLFGPETSTANRCTIGGMLGNNACGLHSLIYGSTRDHTIAVKVILSDGSEAEFSDVSKNEFKEKCKGSALKNKIYQNIYNILSNDFNKKEILKEYPDKEIPRRNNAYALDKLLDTEIFSDCNIPFNFSKLIAGSEGTLAFITEIKLNLIPLPPKEKALIAVHFNSLENALQANLIALRFKPAAIELMDKNILDCTKDNILQNKNRFFIKGEPEAILMIEFYCETLDEINSIATKLEQEIKKQGFGYHFPIIYGNEIKKVWNLRKAGLGVLSNIKGDAKPVSVVEDTAIAVDKLPTYISEFKKILNKYNLNCVYHAHIATGELHLRPMLNLKDKKDVELFHKIAFETAKLVKKYNGSLSGEHGDGRLRGEFIKYMLGENNYALIKNIKQTWDPKNIFNPAKIVDTPSMNTFLRYKAGQETKEYDTYFDFSETKGLVRAIEKCNGSGDCRKSAIIGGTMCPSFMASKNEKNTTRARANMLREVLSNNNLKNPFDSKELYNILDLCLSCKACKSECPSGIDMTKLKAEFMQHYYNIHGVKLRSRLIANITKLNRILSIAPKISNFFMTNKTFSSTIMKMLGFETKRKLPKLSENTLRKQFAKLNNIESDKEVFLFIDEFTNFNDVEIGVKTIRLLQKLNYKVSITKHKESGRTYLSKGLLKKARKIVNKNIVLLKDKITANKPLVGIEPSAILTIRDEYIDLANKKLKKDAVELANNTYLIDEFLAKEIERGNINKNQFTDKKRNILLHGHCQQKAIASTKDTLTILNFPENYSANEIPSGCCGMAGSFGFEKEHYDLSMKIGELVLFPAVFHSHSDTIIAANGTSCRHQIKDGTNREAKHPVEILFEALLGLPT